MLHKTQAFQWGEPLLLINNVSGYATDNPVTRIVKHVAVEEVTGSRKNTVILGRTQVCIDRGGNSARDTTLSSTLIDNVEAMLMYIVLRCPQDAPAECDKWDRFASISMKGPGETAALRLMA